MIFIDSREKARAIKNIVKHFDSNGIQHVSTKLWVGDYMSPNNPLIFIDRKQNLLELAGNATKGHARFKRELVRMDEINGKMYIVVEEELSGLEDVQSWSNTHTKLEGITLYKILTSWKHKHNVEYVFCNKSETGRVISELLGVEN